MSTNSLNPTVVQTLLDKVFYPEWNVSEIPGMAYVWTPDLFRQRSSDKALEKEEIFVGTGYWEETAEEQNIPKGQSRVKDRTVYEHVKFARGENISKEFFDDEQFYVVEDIIRSLADRGRATQNLKGFAVYRNAFTAIGADGVPLISLTHPTNTGTTSNALTTKLTPDGLDEAIVLMSLMKDKDGTTKGHNPDAMFVAPSNYKRACEILESELLADTANNNINMYSSKFGIYLYRSPFISTQEGGSDDNWFLLSSKYHSLTRYVRQPINTYMIDYKQSDNEVYRYNASYRESLGFTNYAGIVGSDGTTGNYN